MATRFQGFPQEMIRFFRELEKNNHRDWFQAHKPLYEEAVKSPMETLVEAVNAELVKFAPEHVNEPKKAIYRIYRDTRFSKDKTPYKLHAGAVFPRRGLEKHGGAGYYFHVSAKEFAVAGGAYMPGKDELAAIRAHIAEHHERLGRLMRSKKLSEAMGELQGESLSRPPKGYPADHSAVDLIKKKQWYYYVENDPAIAVTQDLLPQIVKRFKALREFIDFVNEPLVARKKKSRPDPAFTFQAPVARRRARE